MSSWACQFLHFVFQTCLSRSLFQRHHSRPPHAQAEADRDAEAAKLAELEAALREAELLRESDASALAELRKELRKDLAAAQSDRVAALAAARAAHAAVVQAVTEAHANQVDDAQREREDALAHATNEQLLRVAAESQLEAASAAAAQLQLELKQLQLELAQLQTVHTTALKVGTANGTVRNYQV